MKILVTGAKGQLGRELVGQGLLQGYDIIGLDRLHLDIADKNSIQKAIADNPPDLVINCAAGTDVDKAESEQEKAYSVNRDGPAFLALACAQIRIPLIHLSTDYVFEGRATTPYRETDPVHPIGAYGKSKEAGEDAVRLRLEQHLIIRTSWVYGTYGRNFVKTILRLGQEKETLKIVNDQYGCPTYTGDLADALLVMARKIQADDFREWGTYHCCGSSVTTWFKFASLLLDLAKGKMPLKIKNIIPVSTAEFPTPARRPSYSVLDCAKIDKIFGIRLPTLEKSLLSFFRAMNL